MAVVFADLRYPVATVVPTRRLAVRDVASGGLAKPRLLDPHHDIRTVQELLGHPGVHTHVNRGPAGVHSPADQMLGRVDTHPWAFDPSAAPPRYPARWRRVARCGRRRPPTRNRALQQGRSTGAAPRAPAYSTAPPAASRVLRSCGE